MSAAGSQSACLASRRRVLVIDDEVLIGRTLRRTLSREHDVVTVDSGEGAKRLLAVDQRFDLVLCDLTMPGVSGIDFFAWLSGQWPDLVARVVFMTGGTFTARASEFLCSVDNDTIEKPFDMDQLMSIIASH